MARGAGGRGGDLPAHGPCRLAGLAGLTGRVGGRGRGAQWLWHSGCGRRSWFCIQKGPRPVAGVLRPAGPARAARAGPAVPEGQAELTRSVLGDSAPLFHEHPGHGGPRRQVWMREGPGAGPGSQRLPGLLPSGPASQCPEGKRRTGPDQRLHGGSSCCPYGDVSRGCGLTGYGRELPPLISGWSSGAPGDPGCSRHRVRSPTGEPAFCRSCGPEADREEAGGQGPGTSYLS